jgi:ribosome-binding ATPase YchF (GTP1/OBG family)
MKNIGFCGLPNSGKSTFLKLLTKFEAEIGNYPFTTKKSQIAQAKVISENLKKLHSFTKTKNLIPPFLNFLDVPGLIKGSHKGLGLGNEFLSYLRQADIILEIVRNFKREDVVHPEGDINPQRDIILIEEEIIMADKKILEENITKLKKQPQNKDKLEAMLFIYSKMEPFKRFTEYDDVLKEYNLLITKDWYIVLNGGLNFNYSDFENLCFKKIYNLDFQFELEIESDEEMRKIYSGNTNLFLNNLRKDIGLIEFFTYTNEITQGWFIDKNSCILKACELIHSDFAKKFKYAEVFNINNLEKVENIKNIKEFGLVRNVGKDYTVEEGDIIKIFI